MVGAPDPRGASRLIGETGSTWLPAYISRPGSIAIASRIAVEVAVGPLVAAVYLSAFRNSSRSTPEAPMIWLRVPFARSRACMGTTTR